MTPQFEYVHLLEGRFVAYFLRDTPTPSHCIWLIPGTWIDD